MQPLRLAVLVGLIIVLPARAHGQCVFGRPFRANKIKTSLTQSFVPCGTISGNAPNDSTEGGVPSCSPPETFAALAGNNHTGWRFDTVIGTGQIQLTSVRAFPADNLYGDVAVQLKLVGIVNAFGPVTGIGKLACGVRATVDDPMGGDMTLVDGALLADVSVTGGRANLKTSFDTMLSDMGQPGLPACSNVELLFVSVEDPLGDAFASSGIYLP